MPDYISYWARHVKGEYIQGWDRVERSSEIRKILPGSTTLGFPPPDPIGTCWLPGGRE